eukprot:3943095-Amphidinium_carterae.1
MLASRPWSHEMWSHSNLTARSLGDIAYCEAGDPLRYMSPTARGNLLAAFCRWYDEGTSGQTTRDALAGVAVDGRQLSCMHRSHDYTRTSSCTGIRRVEVKSSRLAWENSRWRLKFSGVKLGEFDVLLLVVYLPWGLD